MSVSVVMNTYRERPDWLRQAVSSVLGQSGVRMKLIVSTVQGDPSLESLKGLPVEFQVSSRPGIYGQLNAALHRVSGDWYCYASSNDVWLPTKLQDEMSACAKGGGGVCYSDYYFADENLRTTGVFRSRPYLRQLHLRNNMVPDVALVSRDILEKYAPFEERWGNQAYWDFWLRISSRSPEVFVNNPKPEWIYRISPSSRHVRRRKDPAAIRRNNAEKMSLLRHHMR